MHTINRTSQWNCPGNSPLNDRVWFLVYKALSHHFQWVQAAPHHRSPHPLWGGGVLGAQKRRMVQIPLQIPQRLPSKGRRLWWGEGQVGARLSPRSIGTLGRQYPGSPLWWIRMGNRGGKTGKKKNTPNSRVFSQRNKILKKIKEDEANKKKARRSKRRN